MRALAFWFLVSKFDKHNHKGPIKSAFNDLDSPFFVNDLYRYLHISFIILLQLKLLLSNTFSLYKAGYHKNPGLEALTLTLWNMKPWISSTTSFFITKTNIYLFWYWYFTYYQWKLDISIQSIQLTSNTHNKFRRAHKNHSPRTQRIVKLQPRLMEDKAQQNPVRSGKGHEACCSRVPPRHPSYQDRVWCKP